MSRTLTDQVFQGAALRGRHYLILFLLWPFLAFITAIINYSQKEARQVVYMFLIYYGLTFVANNESVDAFRYALSLKATADLPFSDFFKVLGGLYSSDTSVDIVEPLISFLISRLTSHHSLYFAVWAAIFGYFYLKSLNLIHDEYLKAPGWNAMILMIFFMFILPITSISGVRMWTAAWIFFYGAYHVVLNRNPKYLLVSFLSVLVHWSYISANAVLLAYFVAGNRNMVYIPLALLSFVLPQLISPVLQSVSGNLGGGIQSRFENYTNEEFIRSVQQSQEQVAWFMQLGKNLVFYYLIAAITIVHLKFRDLMTKKSEQSLFSFMLLFLAFVNFGMAIPTLGGRFQILFFLFATLYLFLCYVKIPGRKISILILIGLFPMILFSVINIRMGSESISAWIFTPGFGVPLLAPVLSLSELIF